MNWDKALKEQILGQRDWLEKEFEFLNKDLSESLGLEGIQAGSSGQYGGKNGKGVCMEDLKIYIAIVTLIKPKNIVETGTYTGFSSCALGKVLDELNIGTKITTIEYHHPFYYAAKSNADKLGLTNIDFRVGNTDLVLKDIIKEVNPEVVFLDGDSLSLEYFITKSMCDTIIGHDMFYMKTELYAPRGADFVRSSKYDGFKLSGFITGECGVGLLYKENSDG